MAQTRKAAARKRAPRPKARTPRATPTTWSAYYRHENPFPCEAGVAAIEALETLEGRGKTPAQILALAPRHPALARFAAKPEEDWENQQDDARPQVYFEAFYVDLSAEVRAAQNAADDPDLDPSSRKRLKAVAKQLADLEEELDAIEQASLKAYEAAREIPEGHIPLPYKVGNTFELRAVPARARARKGAPKGRKR